MKLDQYTSKIMKWLRGGEPTGTAFWINNWLVTRQQNGTVARGILVKGSNYQYELRYKDANLYRGYGYLMSKLGSFDELQFSDTNFVTLSRDLRREPIPVYRDGASIIAVRIDSIVSIFEGIEDITDDNAIINMRKDTVEISFDFSSPGAHLRRIPAFAIITRASTRSPEVLLDGIAARYHPVAEFDEVPF